MSNIHHTLRLASRLTPKRVINASKVVSSYYLSRLTPEPSHRGLPISLGIEPTTSCNLRCPECPSGLRSFNRPTGMLDDALFRKVIDEVHETLVYLTFYFQGEPFLHPRFLSLAGHAASKGIYTSTSTNAHFLTDAVARETVISGLDRLIISIDGTSQDTYESYRIGGSLEKVIEGTRRLLHWRKVLKSRTPNVVFQFLVVKPNEHQVPEVRKLALELGVDDVLLKTAQIYDYHNGSDLIPSQDKYSRYRANGDGTYSIKNDFDNHCWKMWHSCVMTWDGNIVPCCFDKDASHGMGSLQTNTLKEIWQSDRYRSFRASLLRSRSEIEICRNCTEGTQVWA